MSFSLARPSPEQGPARATRQQLDELDALLQRMLDLPVQPADEPATPPLLAEAPESAQPVPAPPSSEPPARAYPPSYMVVETNAPLAPSDPIPADEGPAPLESPVPGGRHDLAADRLDEDETPPEEAGEEWVPFRSSWQPSAQTWGPLARTWEQANGRTNPGPLPDPPLPLPSAGPLVFTRPASSEAPPAAPRPASAPAPAPLAGGVRRPLVWFNAAFDLALAPLGPLGRWLQGPAGRTALGVVGIGCLLAAVALAAADGIGWTW